VFQAGRKRKRLGASGERADFYHKMLAFTGEKISGWKKGTRKELVASSTEGGG